MCVLSCVCVCAGLVCAVCVCVCVFMQPASPWSDNIVKLMTVEQSCRVLTGPLFRDCNSQVDPEPFMEMCVEAACSCSSVGDCACFCDVIAAYAQACSERGVAISWRSNDLCRELNVTCRFCWVCLPLARLNLYSLSCMFIYLLLLFSRPN